MEILLVYTYVLYGLACRQYPPAFARAIVSMIADLDKEERMVPQVTADLLHVCTSDS